MASTIEKKGVNAAHIPIPVCPLVNKFCIKDVIGNAKNINEPTAAPIALEVFFCPVEINNPKLVNNIARTRKFPYTRITSQGEIPPKTIQRPTKGKDDDITKIENNTADTNSPQTMTRGCIGVVTNIS